jgi:hypothetical protein
MIFDFRLKAALACSLFLLCFGFSAGHAQRHPSDAPPTFDQYPATGRWDGVARKPILRTARQRQFRTVIRQQFSGPPNFAGQYRVAVWGCGSGCLQFAIADKNTGVVYDPPFAVVMVDPCGFDVPERLTFQKGSRLLIVAGLPDEDEHRAGTYYYEWTGQKLRLLHRSARRPCHSADRPARHFKR